NGHKDAITDIKFSSDQTCLVSGSEDRSIKIWDIKTGELLRTIPFTTNFAENLLILDYNNYLISGGRDTLIRIWDYKTGKQIGTIKGHYDEIRSIIELPDEKLIASGSDDGTVRVFDIDKMQEVQVLEGHTSFVTSCTIIPNYDSSKEEDSSEVQHKMLEGNFPDYYTYSRAIKKGITTFEDYTKSSKIRPSSKRKAKEKMLTKDELVEVSESDLDDTIKSILKNIKTYKTLNNLEKELIRNFKRQSFLVPENLQDLLIKKLDSFENEGLIELGFRGKSKIVKKGLI
ncbi:MAG: WD40 repeat domain-containing protein, partial [Candidatus Hodarchaeales archaeon]